MVKIRPHFYVGEGIENLREVIDVKIALRKLGIFLEGFGISITGVYVRSGPIIGFEFVCEHPQKLLHLVRSLGAPGEDNKETAQGRFAAGATDGYSFRQVGSGHSLHIEINPDNGKCNAHIDTHGYVVGRDANGNNIYDYNLALEHGYWDLFSDTAPWLFGTFGDTGVVGPMIRPMPGLDGKMHFVFGVTGEW